MHRLRAVIQIQRTLQLAAVAVGPAGRRAEGRIGHVVHHDLAGLAWPGQSDLADAPLGVAHVVGHAAVGVGQPGQATRLAVGVAQGTGDTIDRLHLAGDLPEAVVAVLGAAIGMQHLPQAPLGKALLGDTGSRRHVIAVAHVQIGIRVGDADQAVECIVVIGAGDAARIGGRLSVACRIHREAAGATVRADLPGQITETVVDVRGMQALRVGDLGNLIQCVVLAADLRRHAADVLQDLRQAVQRVVLLAGHALQCVGHGLRVAVGIVGKAGSVVARILQCGQLAERVERPRQSTAQGTAGIQRVFLETVAGVVQRVVNRVACVVLDVSQAQGSIVDVGNAAAIRLGDFLHLAGWPVAQLGNAVLGRAGTAYGDRSRPAAGMVRVIGDHAVGVLDRQRPSERIVGQGLDRLAQRIGHAAQVALAEATCTIGRAPCVIRRVVSIGNSIDHIRARAIHALQQPFHGAAACRSHVRGFAVGIAGNACLAGCGVGYRVGRWLAPGIEGRAGFAAANPGGQYRVGFDVARGGHHTLFGQADRFGHGMDADGTTAHRIGALRIGVLGLDAAAIGVGIQTPAEVDTLVVVGSADGSLRIGQAGNLTRRSSIAAGRQGVVGLPPKRVSHHRTAIGAVGQRHAIGTASVLTGNDTTVGIIDKSAVATPVFRRNAGQVLGESLVLIVIRAHAATRIGHRSNLVLRRVGVGGERNAFNQHRTDQRLIVVGLVDELQCAPTAVGDSRKAVAVIVDVGQRRAIREALGGQTPVRAEGRDGARRIQCPVAVLDQTIATVVVRLIGLADLLERPLETGAFNDANAVNAIQCQVGAQRMGPAITEATRGRGDAGVIETRQCDPAKIEVPRDLILFTGLDIAGVADIAVAGATIRFRLISGNWAHIHAELRSIISARQRATTIATVLVALLRLGSDGGNELFADAGVMRVGPLRKRNRAIKAAFASEGHLAHVGSARRFGRVLPDHMSDLIEPRLHNAFRFRRTREPVALRCDSSTRTDRVACLDFREEARNHRLFRRKLFCTQIGPVWIGGLRLPHPVGDRRVSVQVHDFRLDLVDRLPAELELRRERAGCRQVLDGSHRRLLGLVLGRIAAGLRNTPGDPAFLRLYHGRGEAADGNNRQHGTR